MSHLTSSVPGTAAASLALASLLLLAACESDASPGSTSGTDATPSGAVASPIPAADVVAAIERLDGEFACEEPVQRADDFSWICEGTRSPVVATIHVYAAEVDAPAFGVTLYTQATADQSEEAAAEATRELALQLAEAAVPDVWREATLTWLDERMPEGGRTADLEGAGITASVQPLAAQQWYVELYELDGLEG